MRKAIASVGLLAVGAVAAQTATAQLDGGTDKPWSVSATLRGFYDDNVHTAPSGGQRVDSFGFEVRPSADLNYSSGPNTITASYLYSLRWYDERFNNNIDQSHHVELFFNHNFNERFSLDVSDSFVIAQEPEVLSGTGPVNFPLRSNGNNLRNSANVNFHAQITRLMGIVAGYGNTIYDYEENAGNTITPAFPTRSALLDRVEHTLTLDSTWQLWPQTTGILGYQLGMVRYTSDESVNTPVVPFVASSTRDNNSHKVYVGADHNFRSDLSASVRVGMQYLEYFNSPPGSVQNSISPYAAASLRYVYTDGGLLVVGFSHSHNQTDQAVNAANPAAGITQDQESSTLFGTVTQRLKFLSPNLTGTASAQYQESEFNGGPANGLSDSIFLVGLNLTYHFTRYFSTEVGYNYDTLSSSLTGRGYDRNRLYMGLTATY